jgi:hypothetical protein
MARWLRKGPECPGRLTDGSPCAARVERRGERCHVCLERLAASPDTDARRVLARDPHLPVQLFELLAADPDGEVRLLLARRQDCPMIVLQQLERDEDLAVRRAARTGLSMALSPRVLQQTGRENLFTRAELEAFGQPDGDTCDEAFGSPFPELEATPEPTPHPTRLPASTTPIQRVSPDPVAQPATTGSASAFDEVLARLEALGDRLEPAPDPDPRPTRLPASAKRIRRVSPQPVAHLATTVLASGFDEVLPRFGALGDRLSTLEAAVSASGFDQVVPGFGALGDRLSSLEAAVSASGFDQVEPRFGALGDRLSSVEAAVSASGFDQVVPGFGALGDRLSSLEAAVSSTGLDEVLARLVALDDRLSSLEAALSSTGERLGIIDTRLAEVQLHRGSIRHAGMVGHRVDKGSTTDAEDGLWAMLSPADLDTGPGIRSDAIGSGPSSEARRLARRRRRETRVSPASVVGEPGARPLLPPRSPAVPTTRGSGWSPWG